MTRVAIIGGGIGGLTAANALSRAGIEDGGIRAAGRLREIDAARSCMCCIASWMDGGTRGRGLTPMPPQHLHRIWDSGPPARSP